MPTLWRISDELFALAEAMQQAGGEITDDEAGAILEEWFENLNADLDEKIDHYCALISQLESFAMARENEAKRLTALVASDSNLAKRLRNRLKIFCELHGIKKLDTPRFRISIQVNGSKEPLIFPETWEREPASAPEQYHKTFIALDKDAIRKDAEEAEEAIAKLSDALAAKEITATEYNELLRRTEAAHVVRLGERGSHLRIR